MAFKMKINVPDSPLFSSKKAKVFLDNVERESLIRMTNILQNNIKTEAPVGVSGQLRETIKKELKFEGKRNVGRVYSGVDYGVIIEKGRSAAPVSTEGQRNLSLWIRLSTNGQSFFESLKSAYENVTLDSAVFVLARAMSKKKRKANRFFKRGIAASQADLEIERNKALDKIAKGIKKVS